MTKQYQRIKAKVKPDYLEKDSAFRDCTADKVYTGAVLLNDKLEVDVLGKEAVIELSLIHISEPTRQSTISYA
ncbi:hypothetical protein LMT13_27130, partial [Escherichia coli]|uniref:hypothetical protein n=1 Tax=Escherichia coli TaxID=562 RepID=UPI001E602641